MHRFLKILGWRSRQPPLLRWSGTIFLFLIALSARFAFGTLHGGNPALTFYPAILLASVLLGWKEALLLLGLFIAAGTYLFLPPGTYLLPVGWALVGSLNIAIITALSAVAEELDAANRRQQILFQEAQHRVANTLQAVVGTFQVAGRRMISSPAEAAKLVEEAAERFAASGDVHRRLSDPTLFQRSLGSILQDAVSSVIDRYSVDLVFDIDELDLTFDQMSVIAMLVIEVANNSQKHVFQQGGGSKFSVSLKALPRHRAMLAVRDDGPGLVQNLNSRSKEQHLGFRIIQGLATELHGTFSITPGPGTEIIVEFPLHR
jgi:two-component sensor histidine kinase